MMHDSIASPRSRWHTAGLWAIGLGLLANALVMWSSRSSSAQYPLDLTLDQKAFAQPNPAAPLGARGILMMPAQLGPDTFGLYLLDLDAGNIVVYKALPNKDRFHLMAARNFRNDRLLEDFNNDSLTPKEVQKLIQQQKQRETLEGKGETPPVVPPETTPPFEIPTPPQP